MKKHVFSRICEEAGDPITNKLKNLTSEILSNCIKAIDIRNNQPEGRRRSLDCSSIQKGYHHACYKRLTNLSGKRKINETENENTTTQESLDNRR